MNGHRQRIMLRMAFTMMVTITIGSLHANEVKNSEFDEGSKWWNLNECYSIARGYGENGGGGLKYENYDPTKYKLTGQTLKLLPGREYRFSCRTMVEKLEVKTGHGGARICIEFADKDGKYCGGGYSIWRNSTDGKWVGIEQTCRVPEKAVTARVMPYVDKGIIGVVYFDSIVVEQVDVKPVSAMYVSAYRASAASGEMELIAALELIAAGLKDKDVRGEFAFKDKNGKRKSIEAMLLTNDEARAKVAIEDFQIGENMVYFRLIDRATDNEIVDSRVSTKFMRTEKPIVRKVYVDSQRRLIKDGKPFFPLGFYLTDRSISDAEIAGFKNSGANVVMNYHPMSPETMTKLLDVGIYTFYVMLNTMVGRGFSTQEASDAWVKKTVAAVKDHSSLLGWYVNDELNIEWLDKLKYRQRMYEELDPDHPTWSVIYQMADMRKHMGTCDIIGSDPYPIGNDGNVGLVANWTKQTIAKQFGIRGCIQVIQGFDWGVYWPKKRSQTRMPTKDEMVNMGMQAIACGANGLVYYEYTSLKPMTNDTFKTRFNVAWQDFKQAMHEIRTNERIYILDAGPQVTTDNDKVVARAWNDDGKLVMLVVNASYTEQKAMIKVRGADTKVMTLKPLGYQFAY